MLQLPLLWAKLALPISLALLGLWLMRMLLPTLLGAALGPRLLRW